MAQTDTHRNQDRQEPGSGFVRANNLTLHYLEWESHNKQTLLLLHGIGDNAHGWGHFADAFNGAVRVIALDQRGHGRSDWSANGDYACGDYLRDLEAFVSVLRLDHFVLMGHSMGALHGTRYASIHSDLIAGLVHADIEPHPPDWNKQYLADLYNDLPINYGSVDEYVDHMKYNSPHADHNLLFQIAARALDLDDDGRYRCQYDKKVLSGFDRYDIVSYLVNIKCPTLVLRGTESRVMRRHVAEEMCSMIPDGRLAEIPNAAHPVHTDNPDAFRSAVHSFLKEINFLKDDVSTRTTQMKTVAKRHGGKAK
jgi:pimeloyl-ACP methyl ester carboxylesterase